VAAQERTKDRQVGGDCSVMEGAARPHAPDRAIAIPRARGIAFETPLLMAGLRCSLRYVVLPLAVPFLVAAGGALGIVTAVALGVLLVLDVIAAISIVATFRRLWRSQGRRRWWYVPTAMVLALLVGLFLVSDAQLLRL
jgi:hypothetical protein